MAAFEYSSTTAFVREGFNELRAAWKWVLHIELAEISSLSAAIPASRQRPSRSAPVNNSVHSAIFQRSTSSPNFIFRVWMRSISYRPSTSGGGTYSTCKSTENYGQCLYVHVSMTGALKDLIKTSWTQKSSINCIWAIRSTQYDNSLKRKRMPF